MRPTPLIAAILAAAGLTACHNAQTGAAGAAPGARLCTPFPEASAANGQAAAPAPPADPAAAVDDCLHRWGYALAVSSDPAEAVAMAATAACTSAVARWNQQGLATGATGPQPTNGETAPSLLTGQPTNPIAEHYAYAQGRALFYVVQARAGKCAAPATLTPTGATSPAPPR